MARRMSLLAILILLALVAAGYGALHYMTAVPGTSYLGAPPRSPLRKQRWQRCSSGTSPRLPRASTMSSYDELEKVARYIEATLASAGYAVGRQEFVADGKPVRNIDATIEPAGKSDPEVIVVGAHYDSVRGSPGANDNGSGAAAVLELARLLRDLDGTSGKRIRFVLFVNEEPPYFRTEAMGSLNYARAGAAARAGGGDVLARDHRLLFERAGQPGLSCRSG